MILGTLIVGLLCFGSVQVREIFSLHERKAANSDHDIEEELLENPSLYVYDVDNEKDHLSIHLFIKAEARNALSNPSSLWPDNKIHYKLSNKFDSREKKTILKAMEEFKNRTCIRFKSREKEETPFILVEPGSGCSATVGKANRGKVSLGKGCNNKGIVIHELMHTLGFLHEHSRPDRDEYVEINWENIQEKYKRNFKKYSIKEVDDGNITYDYNSIMHYGANNFAKNRSIPTIITLKENVTIGQRIGFSEHDIEKVITRYGCGKEGTTESIPFQSTENSAETTMDSKKSTKNLDKTTKDTARTTNDPVQSTKDTTRTTNDPVQSTKDTTRTTNDPDPSTNDPVQTTTNSIQSTENLILSTKFPFQTTQTNNKGEDLQTKLTTVVSMLVATNSETTPSPKTMTKLASASLKTALKLSTKAKLAAAKQKPTTNLIKILARSTSIDVSGHHRRNKRDEPQPVVISSEVGKEIEIPKVYETLAAEIQSPLVVEALGVNSKLVEKRESTNLDDMRVRLQEWAVNYRNWWDFYHRWIQEQKPTTEHPMDTTVAAKSIRTPETLGIISSAEEKVTPTIINTGNPNIKNEDQVAPSFLSGSQGASSIENDSRSDIVPRMGRFVTTTTDDPCKSASKCVKTPDASSESTISATEAAATCTITLNCETSGTHSESVVHKSTESVTTASIKPCMTPSDTSPNCVRAGTDITSAVSSQSISFKTKTLEVSTLDINSETESIGRTNSVDAVSTSIESRETVRSTAITIITPTNAPSTVNSDSMAPQLTIVGITSPEAKSSKETNLGSEISVDTAKTITDGKGGLVNRAMSNLPLEEHFDEPEKTVEENMDRKDEPTVDITTDHGSEEDSNVAKTGEHKATATRLPYEYAVDARTHSKLYHIIRIYRPIEGRAALRDPRRRWSGGIVPYELSDKYDEKQKKDIVKGMAEFEKETCVKFVPRDGEPSYVHIEPGDRCQAVIGKHPGRSNITIGEGCYQRGTLIHEFMHCLGFVHEQNRRDRDSYVMVMWDNIIENAKSNFRKHPEYRITNLGIEYDYESVMHYSAYEFAKNPERPTLVPLKAGVKIGNRDWFSKKDILRINTLYECEMKGEAGVEGRSKTVETEDAAASAQNLLQNLLKYFEMNFLRLFRSILRIIQKFRPIVFNARSKEE